MSFQRLSIRTKLIAAFSSVTLVLLGLGGLNLSGMQRMREQSIDIEANWLPGIKILGEMDTLTARNTALLLRHTQAADPKLVASIEEDMQRFGKKLAEKRDTYANTLISSPEERSLYERYVSEVKAFDAQREPVLALSRAGQKAQAYDLYETKALGARRAVSAAIENLMAHNVAGADRAHANSKAMFDQTRAWAIGAMLVGAVLSLLLATFIIRGVTRGINSVVQPMQALAAGNLTVGVPHQAEKTEIGRIWPAPIWWPGFEVSASSVV